MKAIGHNVSARRRSHGSQAKAHLIESDAARFRIGASARIAASALRHGWTRGALGVT